MPDHFSVILGLMRVFIVQVSIMSLEHFDKLYGLNKNFNFNPVYYEHQHFLSSLIYRMGSENFQLTVKYR